MATYEEAEKAKGSLYSHLLSKGIRLRGIGITSDPERAREWAVQAIARNQEMFEAIPTEHNGVTVVRAISGPARAL